MASVTLTKQASA